MTVVLAWQGKQLEMLFSTCLLIPAYVNFTLGTCFFIFVDTNGPSLKVLMSPPARFLKSLKDENRLITCGLAFAVTELLE